MSIKEVLLKDIFSKPISGEWGDEPDENDFVKIIKTNNILNTGRIKYDNITLRKIDHKTVELKKLQYGDILIEKSGGSPANPVGRVCFFDKINEVYLTNNFMSTLRVTNELFYHRYVFYALYSLYQRRVVLNFQNQTTGIINLKLDRYLSTIKIKHIDFTKQQQIAQTLDKAQELIELRKAAIEKLDELAQSIFIDMFGDPKDKYNDDKCFALDDLTERITDGEHQTPKRTDRGTLLLSARNIQQGFIDIINEKVDYIGESEVQRINKRLKIEKNDVLLSCSGTIGRVTTNTLNENFCIVRSVAIIRPNIQKILPKYLVAYLQTNFMQIKMNTEANSSGQPNLFQNQIKKLKIYLPELENQKKFAKIIEKIESQKSLYEAELTKLQENFDALMAQSFEG